MSSAQNVLLVKPPHFFGGIRRKAEYLPLGLAYLAAVLRRHGAKVETFDIYYHNYRNDEIVALFPRGHYDLIGITAISSQYKYLEWLCGAIRALHPDTPIVVGGALATFSPSIVLTHTAADIAVIGEGEQTIIDLVENLDRLDTVNGISYKTPDGAILTTPPRIYLKNIDEIPFPAREVFEIEGYLDSLTVIATDINRTANLVTSRGCAYNCSFCSKTFSGTRFRTVDNVIAELVELKARYGIRGVSFIDELVVVTKKRALELSTKIAPLDLAWNCQARINTVDRDTLSVMKEAGCKTVGFGVESASQSILDRMNKKIDVERTVEVVREANELGLNVIIQMIYGYEGENDDTINETIEFFKKIESKSQGFAVITPLPGSPLYEDCLAQGRIPDEVEYLRKLDWGYIDGRELLVNFTDFTEAEFYEKKRLMEREINKNFLKAIDRKFDEAKKP